MVFTVAKKALVALGHRRVVYTDKCRKNALRRNERSTDFQQSSLKMSVSFQPSNLNSLQICNGLKQCEKSTDLQMALSRRILTVYRLARI